MPTVNVQGTLVDAQGLTWANATVIAKFQPGVGTNPPFVSDGVPINTNPAPVTTNASGLFTMTLPNTDSTFPSGGMWIFIIVPNADRPPVTMAGMHIVGPGTVDISSQFTAQTTLIRVQSSFFPRAYDDKMLSAPTDEGQVYYNTTTRTHRYFENGKWDNLSAEGGAPVLLAELTGITGVVQFSNIPQNYRHLEIVAKLYVGGNCTVEMMLNNYDSPSTLYSWSQITTDGVAVTTSRGNGVMPIATNPLVTAYSGMGSGIIKFPYYSRTGLFSDVQVFSDCYQIYSEDIANPSVTFSKHTKLTGILNEEAPLKNILIRTNPANQLGGNQTVVALYGIP